MRNRLKVIQGGLVNPPATLREVGIVLEHHDERIADIADASSTIGAKVQTIEAQLGIIATATEATAVASKAAREDISAFRAEIYGLWDRCKYWLRVVLAVFALLGGLGPEAKELAKDLVAGWLFGQVEAPIAPP